nr:hypothetical protein [Tanacetum cinerariifolium]
MNNLSIIDYEYKKKIKSLQDSPVSWLYHLLEAFNTGDLVFFNWLSEDRTISLSLIAKRTKLSVEDAEYLIMKSLSVDIIKGIIDHVDGTIYVSWAQPRVLGIPQIRDFRHWLDDWINKL